MFGCSLSLGVSTEWKRPPLSSAFVKTEHILEPKRSHLYPHLGCNLEESAEKAMGRHVCGISLPPTHNSPSGMGQGVRGQPERAGARETSPHSPFPSSQTILWLCVQMLPKCQFPSLVLNSLKPPHYSVSLMNSEYSRDSCKHSALGSNLYRLLRRLKQGQEGRSLFLNPMLLMPAKLLWVFMEICSWRAWQTSSSEMILVPLQALQPVETKCLYHRPRPFLTLNPDWFPKLPGKQDLQRPLPELSTAEWGKGGWKAEDIKREMWDCTRKLQDSEETSSG